MANRESLKTEVARDLGVQIGSKEHNRNQPVAYFGQVGGEMVKRALRQSGFTNK